MLDLHQAPFSVRDTRNFTPRLPQSEVGRGEVPVVGSFSVGPFTNGTGVFRRIPLSSVHFQVVTVAPPAWMSWVAFSHTTRVLRSRIAIRCTHDGRSGLPGLLRSSERSSVTPTFVHHHVSHTGRSTYLRSP